MTSPYLRLELRFLVAKYGRAAVVSALAQAGDVSTEALERELGEIERKSRNTPASHRKGSVVSRRANADRMVAERHDLRRLASLYQSKMFLPSLRDVKGFLKAHGVSSSVKSRDAAYAQVVEVLSNLPQDQLPRLEQGHSSSRDPGAFSLLAGELMNPTGKT